MFLQPYTSNTQSIRRISIQKIFLEIPNPLSANLSFESSYEDLKLSLLELKAKNSANSAGETDVSNYYQESYFLIKRFKNLVKKTDRKILEFKTIRKMVCAFIPMILMIVVYPLHFIPLPNNVNPSVTFEISNFFNQLISIKGMLLTFLAASILPSLGYFSHQCTARIKKSQELQADIKEHRYTDISTYSEKF